MADEVDRLADALELADEPVDVRLLGRGEARRDRAAEARQRGRDDVAAREVGPELVPEAMRVGDAVDENDRHTAGVREGRSPHRRDLQLTSRTRRSYEASMRLDGETILITGSTSGIGRQAAITCAREGARIAVHGRDAERGAAVTRIITDAGGTAVFLAADLQDETACTELVEAAATRLGGLTVLVNNAAGASGGRSPVGALDTALWERVLRVNLTSVAWLCRGAIPHMRRAGHGSIVNVSSRQAVRASAGLAPYVASKVVSTPSPDPLRSTTAARAFAATRSPSATSRMSGAMPA